MNHQIVIPILLTFCLVSLSQEPPAKEPIQPAKKDDKEGITQTIERIVDNANKAGDRLKDKKPDHDTKSIQEEILRDIESLIKRSENPPPMKNDMPPPKEDTPPPPMKSDMPAPMKEGNPPPMKSDMPPPMKEGNPPPMKSNMGNEPNNSPMKEQNGIGSPQQKQPGTTEPKKNNDSTTEGMTPSPRPISKQDSSKRRPRPSQIAKQGNPMPMTPEMKKSELANAEPKKEANYGKDGQPSEKIDPKLPPQKNAQRNERLAQMYQDVWGQLPDRLRQEMDLYYREQFMPRYSDLLRQYYSSIAEQKKRPQGDR